MLQKILMICWETTVGTAFGTLAKSIAPSLSCKACNWVSWLLVLVAKDLLGHVAKSIPKHGEVAQLPATNAAKHKGFGCPWTRLHSHSWRQILAPNGTSVKKKKRKKSGSSQASALHGTPHRALAGAPPCSAPPGLHQGQCDTSDRSASAALPTRRTRCSTAFAPHLARPATFETASNLGSRILRNNCSLVFWTPTWWVALWTANLDHHQNTLAVAAPSGYQEDLRCKMLP